MHTHQCTHLFAPETNINCKPGKETCWYSFLLGKLCTTVEATIIIKLRTILPVLVTFFQVSFNLAYYSNAQLLF